MLKLQAKIRETLVCLNSEFRKSSQAGSDFYGEPLMHLNLLAAIASAEAFKNSSAKQVASLPLPMSSARFPPRSVGLSDVLAGDGVQFLNCLIRQSKASASNIVSRSLPLGSTASLAALPAMSLIPFAPFSLRCSIDDVPGMSRMLGER
jgi:hypothetical protein